MKRKKRIELAIWSVCMALGLAVMLFELAVANAHAERRALDAGLDAELMGWNRQVARQESVAPAAGTGISDSGVADANTDAVEKSQEWVTDRLVDAIIMVESAGNARKVGSRGERGLMQVRRETWAEISRAFFGGRISFDRAFDPALNRRVGTAYLAKLHRFLVETRGNWKMDERSLLLACYNAGPNRVKAAGFNMKNLPASTQDYIRRASALHDDLLQQAGVEELASLALPGSSTGS